MSRRAGLLQLLQITGAYLTPVSVTNERIRSGRGFADWTEWNVAANVYRWRWW